MIMQNRSLVIRIVMSLCGVILTAISVAVLKIAAFGIDPFQSFMYGIVYWAKIRVNHFSCGVTE